MLKINNFSILIFSSPNSLLLLMIFKKRANTEILLKLFGTLRNNYSKNDYCSNNDGRKEQFS